MRYSSTLMGMLLAALLSCTRTEAKPAPLTIAAAADLRLAFIELAQQLERESGLSVTVQFGATGALKEQIRHGAPIDVFASADVSSTAQLVAEGKCAGARVFARGALVLLPKPGLPRLESFDTLKHNPTWKLAIANPEHAPYGRAARQALTRAGLWDDRARSGAIAIGENVSAAATYAMTGNVDVAITARSLMTDDRWTMVPPELFEPLDQSMVVCGTAEQQARATRFIALVLSEHGRLVLGKYGFVFPNADGGTP